MGKEEKHFNFGGAEQVGFAKGIGYRPANNDLAEACNLYGETTLDDHRTMPRYDPLSILLKFYYVELFLEESPHHKKYLSAYVKANKHRKFLNDLKREQIAVNYILAELELDKGLLAPNSETRLVIREEKQRAVNHILAESDKGLPNQNNETRLTIIKSEARLVIREEKQQDFTMVKSNQSRMDFMLHVMENFWLIDAAMSYSHYNLPEKIKALKLIAEMRAVTNRLDKDDPLYRLVYRGIIDCHDKYSIEELVLRAVRHSLENFVNSIGGLAKQTIKIADRENILKTITQQLQEFRESKKIVWLTCRQVSVVFTNLIEIIENLNVYLDMLCKDDENEDLKTFLIDALSPDSKDTENISQMKQQEEHAATVENALVETTQTNQTALVSYNPSRFSLQVWSTQKQESRSGIDLVQIRALLKKIHQLYIEFFEFLAELRKDGNPSEYISGYEYYHKEWDEERFIEIDKFLKETVSEYKNFDQIKQKNNFEFSNDFFGEEINCIVSALKFLDFSAAQVEVGITESVITTRFKAMALIHHPDKESGNKEKYEMLTSYTKILKDWVVEGKKDLGKILSVLGGGSRSSDDSANQFSVHEVISALKFLGFELDGVKAGIDIPAVMMRYKKTALIHHTDRGGKPENFVLLGQYTKLLTEWVQSGTPGLEGVVKNFAKDVQSSDEKNIPTATSVQTAATGTDAMVVTDLLSLLKDNLNSDKTKEEKHASPLKIRFSNLLTLSADKFLSTSDQLTLEKSRSEAKVRILELVFIEYDKQYPLSTYKEKNRKLVCEHISMLKEFYLDSLCILVDFAKKII